MKSFRKYFVLCSLILFVFGGGKLLANQFSATIELILQDGNHFDYKISNTCSIDDQYTTLGYFSLPIWGLDESSYIFDRGEYGLSSSPFVYADGKLGTKYLFSVLAPDYVLTPGQELYLSFSLLPNTNFTLQSQTVTFWNYRGGFEATFDVLLPSPVCNDNRVPDEVSTFGLCLLGLGFVSFLRSRR